MRYRYTPPEVKKAREKAKKEAKKKREHAKQVAKNMALRAKKIAKKREAREKEEEKEKERLKAAKAREKELKRRKEEAARKKAKELKKAKTKMAVAKYNAERLEKKRKERKLEAEKRAKEKKKIKRHEKAAENAKKREVIRKKRYEAKMRKKKKNREFALKYYYEKVRPQRLKERIENHDTLGRFMIATAQDSVVKYKWWKKQWWNDALEIYNQMLEENHKNALCPMEEIASSKRPTQQTSFELMLLKMVNPEVEDNTTAFRDKRGRIVTVKMNNERWQIALKDVWYVEEKFMVYGYNPLRERKTAQWICDNIIENNLNVDNLKRVMLWHNFLIIDWGDDFTFVIGKTEKTTRNLYMALFNKYEDNGYVIFFGYLDKQFVSKWVEKIKEKTGWESMRKGKGTYFSKAVASKSDTEIKNPIPTRSKSTVSTGGKGSSGKV